METGGPRGISGRQYFFSSLHHHSCDVPEGASKSVLEVLSGSTTGCILSFRNTFMHIKSLPCNYFGSFDCHDLEKQFSEARNCVCAGTEFRLGTLTPQQLKRGKKTQLCPLTALNYFDSQAHNVVSLAACYSQQPSILLLKL